MKFKKGEWEKAIKIIFWDLEAIKPTDKNILYNWKLLKGNLEDLYGKKIIKKVMEEDEYETS